MTIEKLLKDEHKAVVLYCNSIRLYYDMGEYWVKGKKKSKDNTFYRGENLDIALKILYNNS